LEIFKEIFRSFYVQKINGKQTFSFTSLLTMRRRGLNLTFTPLTERYVWWETRERVKCDVGVGSTCRCDKKKMTMREIVS